MLNSNGEIIGIACSMEQIKNNGISDAFEFGAAVPSNVLDSFFKETEEIESLRVLTK